MIHVKTSGFRLVQAGIMLHDSGHGHEMRTLNQAALAAVTRQAVARVVEQRELRRALWPERGERAPLQAPDDFAGVPILSGLLVDAFSAEAGVRAPCELHFAAEETC